MTLKVKGTNFASKAVILWNGTALTTTIVDANTLSGTIGSSSLTKPATVQLQVQNTQTMQESQAVPLTIADPSSPTPALTLSIVSLPQGVVGAPYTGTFTAAGGTAPYTWSVTSGQLPAGLTLATNTGILSGTPTANGNYSFGITVTDSSSSVQSATTTVSLPVTAAPVTIPPLTINSPTSLSTTVGLSFSTQLLAGGGTAPYTWSITAGALPAGFSLVPSTGIITGTSSASGTATFTATVADAENPAQSKSISLTLVIAPAPLAITASALASGVQGTNYSQLLQASGGTAPYIWSITSGALPAGLSLAPATGVIAGNPSATGTATFTVTVADAENPAQTKSVSLTLVVAPAELAITTSALPSGTQGTKYSQPLHASGGTAPYTWSITSGALPAGLSLAPATGMISGTPSVSGNFSFGVTVNDAGSPSQGASTTLSLSLVAAGAPLAITSTSLPTGVLDQTYTATLNATGGAAPYIWAITNNALPPGLSLNASGVIAGKPTASSTTSVTFQVTDSSSPAQTATVTITLLVSPVPLTINTSSLSGATNGTTYSNLLQASGGTGTYTWSITSGALPAGLTLSPSGRISGKPTATGTATFSITATDSAQPTAQTASVPLSLVVVAAAIPVLTINASLPPATSGTVYSSTLGVTGGTPAFTWSITSGTLPAGLTLAASTGIISGTPSTAGTYNFTASVSDNGTPVQTSAAGTSITVAAAVQAAPGKTWYVRADGGTRYDASSMTSGQCDGLADAAYAGTGTNQHCAFNDMRLLWTSGAFCNDGSSSSPCWKWVIAGGDTAIVRSCIQYSTTNPFPAIPGSSGPCGIGSQGPTGTDWGLNLAGDNNNGGWPIPPNGTSGQHTKILGGNFASCTAQSARTQVVGTYGVGEVFKMEGASYVDVACFDISDQSSCGRSGQQTGCSTGLVETNFAGEGIGWANTSTNDTVTDVRIHGMAVLGMYGPTGDGVVMTRIDLIGNAGAGWNADKGDGQTGIGSMLMQNFTISWNGCAEEYPIVDALPYQDCTDDNFGGYGDGFGTATVPSPAPGWQAHFDQGVVSYNTQDGLDALHLIGIGSSMTITRVLAYGNMGQQIKVGGAGGVAQNNVIFTNCNAMHQAIPGTPAGYNTNLSDFCRAADAGIVMTTGKGAMMVFDNNTIYSDSGTAIEFDCDGTNGACDSTSLVDFRNNIFVGFLNNLTDGYSNGGTGDYSNPIYNGVGSIGDPNPFTNPGSFYSNNLTFHPKSNWTCPQTPWGEVNGLCVDPNLTDPTWHLYGYGDVTPQTNSPVKGAGVALPSVTVDYTGQTRSSTPSIGAYN